MPKPTITCPETGRQVDTGTSMDVATFLTAKITNAKLDCPACGNTHTWSKDDATFPGVSSSPHASL